MGIKLEKINKTQYVLLEDITRYALGKRFIIRKGFVTDGASIPKSLWWLVGSPFTGNYTESAVIHDGLYASHLLPKEIADDVFLALMKQDDVNWLRRYAMYTAVALFGVAVWNEVSYTQKTDARRYVEVY